MTKEYNNIKTVSVGEVYNGITVKEYLGKDKHGKKRFTFECFCGNEFDGLGTAVKNGYTKSCGCLARRKARERLTKHGMCGTLIYGKWQGMKARCYSKSYEHYDLYGGRGIIVCDRWKDDFLAFYEDMGDIPFEGAELDRIDNDGNYEKDNCRWVTRKENTNNRRKPRNETGYTGVTYKPRINRYQAQFHVDRKQKYVGVFPTAKEAAIARTAAIKEYNEVNGTTIRYEDIA